MARDYTIGMAKHQQECSMNECDLYALLMVSEKPYCYKHATEASKQTGGTVFVREKVVHLGD